ncbi:FAD:protein FMN transferase [Terriglobus aquaticus]|uniref:FAD:protein FMN transferase n=1 Tax=Terriglobus aquaticus TaxID=940139 RepID=A0ABW9KJI5_9BACT|nr:FAD:protein FMN transferase [Terriglobus aquaticus]
MRFRTAAVSRSAALLLSLLTAWPGQTNAFGPDVPERLFTLNHGAMATEWQLVVSARDETRAAELAGEVFDEVDRLEDLLSNYRPHSELSRINADAASGPVTTDPETFAFLEEAQHWSRASDGAFDITVGPLMKAWGFFRKEGRVPNSAELQALHERVGSRKMELQPANRSVLFRVPGVELDPGGIGKGFAVDAGLRILRAAGVRSAMLSAGSSTIGTIGPPAGSAAWRVNAHDPWRPGNDVTYTLLRDTTLSTANCAEKNFTLQGHRYCHIMDPRTLRPVENVQQVTIVDPSATASDALSNALFVLSPSESIRLLHSLPNDRALIVTGAEDHRVCTAIRWRQPIAPGFCRRVVEVE